MGQPDTQQPAHSMIADTKEVLQAKSLPSSLWSQAVHHAAWIKNRIFTCSLNTDTTPYQAYSGKKPSLAMLRLFGCKAYAHTPKVDQTKFGECTIECVHIGFAEEKRPTYYTAMSAGRSSSHVMSSLKRLRVVNTSLLTQTVMMRVFLMLLIPEMVIQRGNTQLMPPAHPWRRWITRRSKRPLLIPTHILAAHNPHPYIIPPVVSGEVCQAATRIQCSPGTKPGWSRIKMRRAQCIK